MSDPIDLARALAKNFKSEVDVRLLSFLELERILFKSTSPFQEIVIGECSEHSAVGRVLFLDGVLQLATVDESFYHEMIVHVPLNSLVKPERVLIIGGGDGGTLRELLKYPTLKEIYMVEIDEQVVKACTEHMPSVSQSGRVYRDSRVDLRIDDGAKFVREWESGGGLFDAILIDSSGHHGPGNGLFGHDFFAQCARILKPEGVLVTQSEAPTLVQNVVGETVAKLGRHFRHAGCYLTCIPTFMSGYYTFSWASPRLALNRLDPKIVSHNLKNNALSGIFYNLETHYASFALPNWYRWMVYGEAAKASKPVHEGRDLMSGQ